MIVTCETLRDTAGVLTETQREILLLTLVEKLKSVLAPRMVLSQVSGNLRPGTDIRNFLVFTPMQLSI